MQKVSMRKLSLLGLVLLAASAVTAAVMPKDKSDKTTEGYSLTVSTGGACGNLQLSCTVSDLNDDEQPCTNTGDSNTTVGGGTNGTDGTSVLNGQHTAAGGGGDSTGANSNTSLSPC